MEDVRSEILDILKNSKIIKNFEWIFDLLFSRLEGTVLFLFFFFFLLLIFKRFLFIYLFIFRSGDRWNEINFLLTAQHPIVKKTV